MKIEHDKLSLHTGGTDAPARAAAPAGGTSSGAAAGTAAAGADALTLSPELRRMQAATQAAHDQPAVRGELVARMRELLERGEVGNDPVRLADALIDGALGRA